MRNELRHDPKRPNAPVKKDRLGTYRVGGVMLDGKHVADTLWCVHCSASWIVQPGSGKLRGWCVNCKGPLCGSPDCDDKCIPLEMRLQQMERNLTRNEVYKELDKMPKTIIIGAKDLSPLK